MTTTVKTCRECDEEKPINKFYRHKQMGDGYLNKCKRCVKERVSRHRELNLGRIRAYDRMRYKENEHRQEQLRNLTKSQPPERRKVHYMVGNAIRDGRLERPDGCWSCGDKCKPDAHHSYYDIDRPLDVTWLCRSCHVKAHKLTA